MVNHRPYFKNVKIASVNCDQKFVGEDICTANHVNGYPTIIMFKNDAEHSHDHYHGDRSPDSFTKFIRATMDEMGMDPFKVAKIKQQEARAKGLPHVAETVNDGTPTRAIVNVPTAAPEGCNIAGFVKVAKVPGNFHISAHAAENSGFNFNPEFINMTHIVNHLAFGSLEEKEKFEDYVPTSVRSDDWMDGTMYLSESKGISHEHYLKVVSYHFEPAAKHETVASFKYTYNSNEYQVHDELPEARFSYDISPMAVKITEVVCVCFLNHVTFTCC
jgi:hypothetical protein